MANLIKYEAARGKYSCGTDLLNIGVINFTGPDASKFCAYCCNMNVDNDGEPQAYGPFSKPQLRPKDNLGNAGWKSAADNAALKAGYEAEKAALGVLEQKKIDLVAKLNAATTKAAAPATTPSAAKPAVDATVVSLAKAIAEMEKAILQKKRVIVAKSLHPADRNGDAIGNNPKNFESIFWQWYGVTALTPSEARSVASYLEMSALKPTIRRPVLDQTSYYEDAFGRFPVIQSAFEPGPGYFVSPLPPGTVNHRFPSWDQRHFIPEGASEQEAFGALSTGLAGATGLKINDTVFAVRLDTAATLAFPFRDSGNGHMVAECSFAAFVGLGGVYHPELENAAKFPNNFLLLYLAFPASQSPASTLSRFASADNASDLPLVLSFIVQATVDASTRGSKTITGDPLMSFKTWKQSGSTIKPKYYDTVVQALGDAGSDFVKHMMRTHKLFPDNGPLLRPPTR